MVDNKLQRPLTVFSGGTTTRRTNRLASLGRAVLFVCISIQAVTLLPTLYHRLSWLRTGSAPFLNDVVDPAHEWHDDIFPLREPTAWDISTDFPYQRTLSFDVDEGTWLRLDIHPKSGEIVFDMLGDLYCLPASAYLQLASDSDFNDEPTKARPVITGVPFDADPHFSPNGAQLVFRSDAQLGVENIWVTEWTNCDDMSVDRTASAPRTDLLQAFSKSDEDEFMFQNGIKETYERKRRRLLREGRLNARRITNETYRWVTDARFHPSGESVITTKWYTSTRSLGAGEGWQYDIPKGREQRKVGDGRRIVGRTLPRGWSANDYGEQQVGPEQFIWLGEDAVIYAKNVIDSQGQFNYDKDVHSGIYSIFKYNLTSKTTEMVVPSSPGGASRPELSRDGTTLAFVRRVRDKEALVLKDLQSGTLRNIWYGLSYDVAGISAPMGTYPSFSFTPNDDAIIIWAAGKLWHVPLLTNVLGEKVLGGTPKRIPFRATVSQRLAATRTNQTDVLSLEKAVSQRLHALVDLAVDDTGSRIAFQGAGVTYWADFNTWLAKSYPNAAPVLRPGSAYYSPSFVPGRNDLLIHTRWSDRNYSTFEIAELHGLNAYELTGLPLGRYIHPTICACEGDNRQIAFVKVSSDYLTNDFIATANPGLYVGKVTLPDASFGRGGSIAIEEVQYLGAGVGEYATIKFLDGNKRLLVQEGENARVIDLASGPDGIEIFNETIVANGLYTTELALPNDLDKLAFVDSYNVFVVKKGDVGDKPLWSKPGNATKGIARVSLDGGHDIQWSADGKKLFWFLGPFLHSLEISRLSECSSEIKSDGSRFGIDCIKNILDIMELDVGYTTDIGRLMGEARTYSEAQGLNAMNEGVYAITNASLLTMSTGDFENDFIANATVVIRNGVIEGVDYEASIPDGATILNAEGGFVVPGFIDVHAHWAGFGDSFPARSWEMETFLSYGVTTMHNPSSDNVRGFVERARIENGMMIGPRIFHTGNVIYGAGWGAIHNDVADLQDARSALIRIKVEGGPASFSYKNYNQYSRASRQRLLLEARNLSMLCFPEGGMNQDWDLTYIIDGMTTVEHALPVPQLFDDVLNLYALSGTGATPTHIVNYGGTMGEQYLWAHVDVANDPKLRRFTRHDILESVIETTHRPLDSFQLFNTSASIAKMVRKGLRANIGAHGEPPIGMMYHAELAFAAAGGLTNYEALRAATRDAALTLGIDKSLGSISPGLLADLVIYPPGIDLLNDRMTRSLELKYVMRGGRVWDAETMVEEWPVKGRRRLMPIINAD